MVLFHLETDFVLIVFNMKQIQTKYVLYWNNICFMYFYIFQKLTVFLQF